MSNFLYYGENWREAKRNARSDIPPPAISKHSLLPNASSIPVPSTKKKRPPSLFGKIRPPSPPPPPPAPSASQPAAPTPIVTTCAHARTPIPPQAPLPPLKKFKGPTALEEQPQPLVPARAGAVQAMPVRPPTNPSPRDDALWIHKHEPRSYSELLGNKKSHEQLLHWVRRRSTQRPSICDPVAAFVEGPCGVGKSTGVSLLLKQERYHVVDTLTPASYMHKPIDEHIAKFLGSYHHEDRVALVIEDVDAIAELIWDRPSKGNGNASEFYAKHRDWHTRSCERIRKAATRHKPVGMLIVFTCTNADVADVRALKPACNVVHWNRLFVEEIAGRLAYIALMEQPKMQSSAGPLAHQSNGDLRLAISSLQFDSVLGGSQSHPHAVDHSKDPRFAFFEATNAILLARTSVSARKFIRQPPREHDIHRWIEGDGHIVTLGLFCNYAAAETSIEECARAADCFSCWDSHLNPHIGLSSRDSLAFEGHYYCAGKMAAGATRRFDNPATHTVDIEHPKALMYADRNLGAKAPKEVIELWGVVMGKFTLPVDFYTEMETYKFLLAGALDRSEEHQVLMRCPHAVIDAALHWLFAPPSR